ncbi:stage V sporulation protein B [Defluviitalea raffinosedens]|uniref:Stage V sporulation protein B n=1 Tax=Defluviitalea raffinosedens TaxID=1450156 RepID=A0A7C8HF65_9FIRM|nr:stage V sporulation protein B [Defluviitalea raffinosedens]KAE9628451.1 stage V sporulation protein B [Defluviitalea raffinosedens]
MAKKNLVTGALILTAASFITRILGFIYRIYMSNLIGAEGMGLYQLIFPIYMLAWTISASGISLSVSKLVAQENAKREYGNMHRIVKISVLLSVGIGFIISAFIYYFAPWIASSILKEPRTILSLKILAVCVPFMAAASSIKGYFYGMQEMTKPAVSQVLEQISRMLIIYFLASFFIPKGLSYACALSVIGICAGEFISFLYVCISYKRNKQRKKIIKKPTLNLFQAYSALLAMAIPLTGNRFITSLLSSIENIMIPIQLQAFGMSNTEAISIYGQFSGMAMPLIFFPSMVTGSLSVALVPAVSEAKAVNNTRQIHRTVSKSIHFTSLIGIGATCLFAVFSKELGLAVYNQEDVGDMLYSMAWICPFFYLQTTLAGILNGLGQQVATFKHNVIGSIISILFIYFFVPMFGFKGFLWAVIVSSITITLLHLRKVLKFTSLTLELSKWVIRPGLAATASALTAKYIMNHYLLTQFSLRWSMTFTLIALAASYIIFLFLLQSITKEDLKILKRNI